MLSHSHCNFLSLKHQVLKNGLPLLYLHEKHTSWSPAFPVCRMCFNYIALSAVVMECTMYGIVKRFALKGRNAVLLVYIKSCHSVHRGLSVSLSTSLLEVKHSVHTVVIVSFMKDILKAEFCKNSYSMSNCPLSHIPLDIINRRYFTPILMAVQLAPTLRLSQTLIILFSYQSSSRCIAI